MLDPGRGGDNSPPLCRWGTCGWLEVVELVGQELNAHFLFLEPTHSSPSWGKRRGGHLWQGWGEKGRRK